MCVFMSGPKNVIGDHVNVQLAAEVQQKEAAHKKKKERKACGDGSLALRKMIHRIEATVKHCYLPTQGV